MYSVRRIHIGKTKHLDELAHACGELYSKPLVFFWRTVRHKGIWLKPKHLMRLFTSDKLHTHTSDATVQAFFAALKSWRQRRKTDPTAKPPRKRKWHFRVEYKTKRKSSPKGRLFRCTNPGCGWTWHRDGVGAINIRKKYRGEFGVPLVVGVMAPPTSMRYTSHVRVARSDEMGTFLS